MKQDMYELQVAGDDKPNVSRIIEEILTFKVIRHFVAPFTKLTSPLLIDRFDIRCQSHGLDFGKVILAGRMDSAFLVQKILQIGNNAILVIDHFDND